MLLLIDNYDSFTYNLYQALSLLHEEVKVIRNDQMSVEEIVSLENLEGIIVSPGPGTPEEAGICIETIQRLGEKVPILGVCLGHQAIGAAFGATIQRAEIMMHGKDSLIFHHRKHLFQGMPLPFKAGRYHSLIVSKNNLPSTLDIDAEDVAGEIMALSHSSLPIFGVQFHPESILTPQGMILLKNFVNLCLIKNTSKKETMYAT
jgi:anthranilate synthase component 2